MCQRNVKLQKYLKTGTLNKTLMNTHRAVLLGQHFSVLHNCLSPTSETFWCCFNPLAYLCRALASAVCMCVCVCVCVTLIMHAFVDPLQLLIDFFIFKELIAKLHM